MIHLQDYDISEKTGFLPEHPPLKRLPGESFSQWEDLLEHLPQLIKEKRLRQEVDKLPEVEFSEKTLKSEEEWRRACQLMMFIGQGYLWMDGDNGIGDTVPRKLAVPWNKASQHIGIPPVSTYATAVLYNYALKDPTNPIVAENLDALETFTGALDESWFYVTHVCVEMAAVPGLKAIEKIYTAMANQRNDTVSQELQVIAKSIEGMTQAANRMYEHCDQKFFFVNIRCFNAGSEGIETLPDGLIYEGVDTEPKRYSGGSGGQSTSVHSFDIFLGIEHTNTANDLEFIGKMYGNMPKKHREFLFALRQQPSLKKYISQSKDPALVLSYNQAVDALKVFRSKHVILAARYITIQKPHSVNHSLDDVGTGGIPNSIEYLKRLRDDTESAKLT